MTVGVIDSGLCNLFSLMNAFKTVGVEASRLQHPDDLEAVDRIVLPGVGSFAAGMEKLQEKQMLPAIRQFAASGKLTMGICLGMQLLCRRGVEGGSVDGLGIVDADTVQLETHDKALPVPHVGWNNFEDVSASPLLASADLPPNPDFYFVHGYHVVPNTDAVKVCTVGYGVPVVGAMAADNVFGCQFHPEISHINGLKVLKAFAEYKC